MDMFKGWMREDYQIMKSQSKGREKRGRLKLTWMDGIQSIIQKRTEKV